jgi:elongator complex protein 3
MDPDVDEDLEFQAACREIIDELLASKLKSKDQLNAIKIRHCKAHGLPSLPKDAQVLHHATAEERELLAPVLRLRRNRTISGISVVAVMTKPVPCPGSCVYCPGEKSQPDRPVAKSYTGREPAALRSLMYDYDPYDQVASRIDDLEAIGHSCDKIELIVMGGTFLSAPKDYQDCFVQGCIDGVLGKRTSSLDEAKSLAETSARRITAITFETRPDYCDAPHVDAMLDYGGTRVEIGVQTTFDDIYTLVNRGHDTAASKHAIQVAKDAGFKVCVHVMPNLPGSSVDRDREMFATLFDDEGYRPDYLKIYPCLVVDGTVLKDWWDAGTYKPYPTEDLIDMLADVKARLPSYTRIQRVQRDIPANLILDGVRNGNLREMVWAKMQEKGLHCNCIRCREYGFSQDRFEEAPIPSIEDLVIQTDFYPASGGMEAFISALHPDTGQIFGYVRARRPSDLAHRSEVMASNSAVIRELRVVGEVVPINKIAKKLQAQHRGLGKKLMNVAEELAVHEFGAEKMLVIAGLGVRPYFYGLGYEPDGPYVSKLLG